MSDCILDLESEIVDQVARQLPKGAGFGDFVSIELVGSLVRAGLDAIVGRYGDEGVALSQAAKVQIRAFVSANTLRYLEGLVAGLGDLKGGLAPES